MSLTETVLAQPWGYKLLQFAVGSDESHHRFIDEQVRLAPGERLLDIGCGPGHILRSLPDHVDYVGVDVSPEYIEAARDEWGERGEFHCLDVSRPASIGTGFDVVLVMGVLHHIDDAGCAALLTLASGALAPTGRFVAIEPAWAPRQGAIARWLIGRDRGEHVRDATGYGRLVEPHFGSVSVTRRRDLLRIPYTHAILQCREPEPALVAP